MKKQIAVLVVLLLPTLLVAQPKQIAEGFMSGSKNGLQVIAKRITPYIEPNAFYSPVFSGTKFLRSEFQFPKGLSVAQQTTTPVQATITRAVANQINNLNAQILSTTQLVDIARMSIPTQTFLEGKNDVACLLVTDTSFEFFEPSTNKEGIIYARAKKDLDVADLQTNSFYTIAKGDVVQFSQQSIETLVKQYAQTHETTVLRTVEKVQNAARNATGKRNFLFPNEFIQFVEEDVAHNSEFFAGALGGRKITSSTPVSFLPVKKDITVLTEQGLHLIKTGTFIDIPLLRLGEINKSVTLAYNIELPEEQLQTLLQNNPGGIPALFSRSGTYTDKSGTFHKIVRLQTPMEINTLGTVREGTYLDVANPEKLTIFDETLLKNSSY